jgi:hypothetical protein
LISSITVIRTTVQEKAVAFPTDARLYHKAKLSLVRIARRFGIPHAAAKSGSSQQVQRLSDQKIKTFLTDLGYRSHSYLGEAMINLVAGTSKR